MLENDPKSRIYPIIGKGQILVKKSQLLIGQIKKKSNILKVSQGPNIVKKMRLFGWLSNIIIYVIYLE